MSHGKVQWEPENAEAMIVTDHFPVICFGSSGISLSLSSRGQQHHSDELHNASDEMHEENGEKRPKPVPKLRLISCNTSAADASAVTE